MDLAVVKERACRRTKKQTELLNSFWKGGVLNATDIWAGAFQRSGALLTKTSHPISPDRQV